jgi:hypothetical protein
VVSTGLTERSFRPGELAPVSGVYLVTHLTPHREPHEAMVIRGELLAACRVCRSAVTYEVLQATSHMTHDWDFAGPKGPMVRARPPDFSDLRTFPRSEIEFPIVVEHQSNNGPALFQGHAKDLSEGGIGAIVEGQLPSPRAAVALRMPFGEPVRQVTMTAHLRHRNGMRHGFKFGRLDMAQREAIRRLLRAPRSS